MPPRRSRGLASHDRMSRCSGNHQTHRTAHLLPIFGWSFWLWPELLRLPVRSDVQRKRKRCQEPFWSANAEKRQKQRFLTPFSPHGRLPAFRRRYRRRRDRDRSQLRHGQQHLRHRHGHLVRPAGPGGRDGQLRTPGPGGRRRGRARCSTTRSFTAAPRQLGRPPATSWRPPTACPL